MIRNAVKADTERITVDDRLADTRIIMLTTFDIDQYVYGAIRAGASGFLLKDTSPTHLLEAIRVVSADDALIAPSITRRLISELATRPDPTAAAGRLDGLTKRELGILIEVGRGRTNPRDRRNPHHQPPHRQNARQPHNDQTRRAKQNPTRCRRLRNRTDHSRRMTEPHIDLLLPGGIASSGADLWRSPTSMPALW